jgi:hypothetical protein
MPEIEEECTFVAEADKVKFTTQTNGEIIILSGIQFNREQAASFAWLVNHPQQNLTFQVKLQE